MKPIVKIMFALGITGMATLAFAEDHLSSANQPPMTLTRQQFVSDAAVGGMKEVFLSRMALETSTNAEVKRFAKRMVKDHGAANKELMKIATEEGLNFPPTNTFAADDPNWSNPTISNPETLKGAQLLTMTNLPYVVDYRAVKHLQSLTGDQFDQAYLNDMAGDHVMVVNEFEMASQNLADPKLKKFATKTLPTLRDHSKMAHDLSSRYNGGTNTVSQSSQNMATQPPMAY
jgi:putative membrane protein